MQKILLGPSGSPHGNTLEGVGAVRQLGLHAMEAAFTHGIHMRNELAQAVGAEQKKHGTALSIHAPYYINLSSSDERKIAESKQRILRSAELARYMNASPVVFHPGFYGKRSKEEVYEMIRDAVDEMQKTIRKEKWGVEIAPETMGRVFQFGTLGETLDIARATKSGFCIDICHIYARNQGKIDYDELFSELKGSRRVHFQFSGVEYNKHGEKRHLLMESDSPPFAAFAEALLESRLDATIICESPATWQDSLRMKEVLIKLGHRF